MKSFSLIGAMLAAGFGGAYASEFNLKGLHDHAHAPTHSQVATLKFGGGERRRIDGKEEITVVMANGDEVVIPLEESEDLMVLGTCGGHSNGARYNDENLDVMVTGCEGEDRSITIGGHGSWDYEAETEFFRRVDHEEMERTCASVEPPAEALEAQLMRTVSDNAQPPASALNKSEFKIEIRYYYDRSLLASYDGDHTQAKAAVQTMHEHASVLLRHPTIGRPVHLWKRVEAKFLDYSTQAGPANALEDLRDRLRNMDLCQDHIGFHHVITAHGGDMTGGVAIRGTVCHNDCWNVGITEIWGSPSWGAGTLAHELGHNLGMSHDFVRRFNGRGCKEFKGIMNYGKVKPEWSVCSKESWAYDYEHFVEKFGQERADGCFLSASGVTPVTPNPDPTPVQRPTPRPVQSPTPRPVQSPTPRPVQPTPAPPTTGGCTCSGRTTSRGQGGASCNSKTSRGSWCYTNRNACSDGIPSRSVPGQEFSYQACKSGARPAPTPTTPAPRPTPAPMPTPTPPTSGGCVCSGRTSSSGRGGPRCDTTGSRGKWCYTDPNACSDGIPSRSVRGQEFSHDACKSGAQPAPAPTPRPEPRPTPRPTFPAPRPTPAPPTRPGGCRCSGRTSSSGKGGADCATRGSRGYYCFTAPDACSDGIRSRAVPGQEYSYMACRAQRG